VKKRLEITAKMRMDTITTRTSK